MDNDPDFTIKKGREGPFGDYHDKENSGIVREISKEPQNADFLFGCLVVRLAKFISEEFNAPRLGFLFHENCLRGV